MEGPMKKADREALRRALRMTKGERAVSRPLGPEGSDAWWDEATSAAYSCQMDNLRLRPWQDPPCWACDDKPVDDHTHGRVAAWELRRRLLKAGLSQYEPDPVAALEAVAARQRDRAGHLTPNGAKPDSRPPV
jgi:hypothetical protein